jgi:hypothetical protein
MVQTVIRVQTSRVANTRANLTSANNLGVQTPVQTSLVQTGATGGADDGLVCTGVCTGVCMCNVCTGRVCKQVQ